MAKRLRLFLPAHEPDFGRDIALRCPRPRVSGRHRCAAERGADGAARRLHQVQGFNARSFVSGKSRLGGEGRDGGERFFKFILAAWAASPRGCLEGRLKEPGETSKSNRQSQILNRKLIYVC